MSDYLHTFFFFFTLFIVPAIAVFGAWCGYFAYSVMMHMVKGKTFWYAFYLTKEDMC